MNNMDKFGGNVFLGDTQVQDPVPYESFALQSDHLPADDFELTLPKTIADIMKVLETVDLPPHTAVSVRGLIARHDLLAAPSRKWSHDTDPNAQNEQTQPDETSVEKFADLILEWSERSNEPPHAFLTSGDPFHDRVADRLNSRH